MNKYTRCKYCGRYRDDLNKSLRCHDCEMQMKSIAEQISKKYAGALKGLANR